MGKQQGGQGVGRACSSAKASPRSANRWRAMMVLRSRMRHWSSCVSCNGGAGGAWNVPWTRALARKACTMP